MKKKKNSFLTFIFSLLPGAGQMYMGFMKRGLSLMTLFFLIIFIGAWLNIGPIMFFLPMIWFYSFFDVYNLRAYPDQELMNLNDDYLFITDINENTLRLIKSKYRIVCAIALIVIGASILWNNTYSLLSRILPSYISNFVYQMGVYIPQLAVGVAIILLGVYLIRGKKKELDLLEDKGGLR